MSLIDQAVELERATPKNWGFGKSKEKGTPSFWMDFEFTQITDNDNNPYTVRQTWWITDNTIDYMLRDLYVLGWSGKDMTELDPNEAASFSFYGHDVLLTVEMQEYKNKMYPRVKFINPLDYTSPQGHLEPKEFKSLANKLKGKIAAWRSKNTLPPPTNGKKDEYLPSPEEAPVD